jgi:hypothetical protein
MADPAELDRAIALLRGEGYVVARTMQMCKPGCPICNPAIAAAIQPGSAKPYLGRSNRAITEARAMGTRTHPL